MDYAATDTETLNIIDKLVEFVAKNGEEFEALTKQKHYNNPKFGFLFGGPYHSYYVQKLQQAKNHIMAAATAEQSGSYSYSSKQVLLPAPQKPLLASPLLPTVPTTAAPAQWPQPSGPLIVAPQSNLQSYPPAATSYNYGSSSQYSVPYPTTGYGNQYDYSTTSTNSSWDYQTQVNEPYQNSTWSSTVASDWSPNTSVMSWNHQVPPSQTVTSSWNQHHTIPTTTSTYALNPPSAPVTSQASALTTVSAASIWNQPLAETITSPWKQPPPSAVTSTWNEPPISAAVSSSSTWNQPPAGAVTSTWKQPPPSAIVSSTSTWKQFPPSAIASPMSTWKQPPPSATASSTSTWKQPPPSATVSSNSTWNQLSSVGAVSSSTRNQPPAGYVTSTWKKPSPLATVSSTSTWNQQSSAGAVSSSTQNQPPAGCVTSTWKQPSPLGTVSSTSTWNQPSSAGVITSTSVWKQPPPADITSFSTWKPPISAAVSSNSTWKQYPPATKTVSSANYRQNKPIPYPMAVTKPAYGVSAAATDPWNEYSSTYNSDTMNSEHPESWNQQTLSYLKTETNSWHKPTPTAVSSCSSLIESTVPSTTNSFSTWNQNTSSSYDSYHVLSSKAPTYSKSCFPPISSNVTTKLESTDSWYEGVSESDSKVTNDWYNQPSTTVVPPKTTFCQSNVYPGSVLDESYIQKGSTLTTASRNTWDHTTPITQVSAEKYNQSDHGFSHSGLTSESAMSVWNQPISSTDANDDNEWDEDYTNSADYAEAWNDQSHIPSANENIDFTEDVFPEIEEPLPPEPPKESESALNETIEPLSDPEPSTTDSGDEEYKVEDIDINTESREDLLLKLEEYYAVVEKQRLKFQRFEEHQRQKIDKRQTRLLQLLKKMAQECDRKVDASLEAKRLEGLQEFAKEVDCEISTLRTHLNAAISTGSKDAISRAKKFICQASKEDNGFADLLTQYLLHRIIQPGATYSQRLHVIYLINDLVYHLKISPMETLQSALESVVVPIFCWTFYFARVDSDAGVTDVKLWSEETTQRRNTLSRVLSLWTHNDLFPLDILEEMGVPSSGKFDSSSFANTQDREAHVNKILDEKTRFQVQQWRAEQNSQYSDVIQTTKEPYTSKYALMQREHSDFLHQMEDIRLERQRHLSKIESVMDAMQERLTALSDEEEATKEAQMEEIVIDEKVEPIAYLTPPPLPNFSENIEMVERDVNCEFHAPSIPVALELPLAGRNSKPLLPFPIIKEEPAVVEVRKPLLQTPEIVPMDNRGEKRKGPLLPMVEPSTVLSVEEGPNKQISALLSTHDMLKKLPMANRVGKRKTPLLPMVKPVEPVVDLPEKPATPLFPAFQSSENVVTDDKPEKRKVPLLPLPDVAGPPPNYTSSINLPPIVIQESEDSVKSATDPSVSDFMAQLRKIRMKVEKVATKSGTIFRPSVPFQPFWELPAALMIPLIPLSRFEYQPLKPKDIRIPPPPLQSEKERLEHVISAFYAPPTSKTPRNADGWEKTPLIEYTKKKIDASKRKAKAAQENGDSKEIRKDYRFQVDNKKWDLWLAEQEELRKQKENKRLEKLNQEEEEYAENLRQYFANKQHSTSTSETDNTWTETSNRAPDRHPSHIDDAYEERHPSPERKEEDPEAYLYHMKKCLQKYDSLSSREVDDRDTTNIRDRDEAHEHYRSRDTRRSDRFSEGYSSKIDDVRPPRHRGSARSRWDQFPSDRPQHSDSVIRRRDEREETLKYRDEQGPSDEWMDRPADLLRFLSEKLQHEEKRAEIRHPSPHFEERRRPREEPFPRRFEQLPPVMLESVRGHPLTEIPFSRSRSPSHYPLQEYGREPFDHLLPQDDLLMEIESTIRDGLFERPQAPPTGPEERAFFAQKALEIIERLGLIDHPEVIDDRPPPERHRSPIRRRGLSGRRGRPPFARKSWSIRGRRK